MTTMKCFINQLRYRIDTNQNKRKIGLYFWSDLTVFVFRFLTIVITLTCYLNPTFIEMLFYYDSKHIHMFPLKKG